MNTFDVPSMKILFMCSSKSLFVPTKGVEQNIFCMCSFTGPACKHKDGIVKNKENCLCGGKNVCAKGQSGLYCTVKGKAVNVGTFSEVRSCLTVYGASDVLKEPCMCGAA